MSRFETIAPTMTIRSTTIDAIRTGLSAAMANFGFHQRTNMPIATGMSTIANTSTAFANCTPSSSWSGRNSRIAKLVMSGRVKTAMTELTAVSEMLRATSPRNR